jgi:regulator of PEP synthase PpsR (kinase-PPPase family)
VSAKKLPTVYVVSDGRGDTAQQLLDAAAVQFEGMRYTPRRRASVRSVEQVAKVVREAAREKAVIFYTLVEEEVRKAMRRNTRERHVASVDILGQAFTALHDLFHRQRGATPGLLYARDSERIDRMNAIDYTLKHDDGQRPSELDAADVVLVGVSRSSKSTTCFYLASEGIRAANVPLVPGIDLPRKLLSLPKNKVIGLRIDLTRLLAVRESRATGMGLGENDPYVDRRTVGLELAAANRTIDENGWRAIDASYLAIEEIAHEVMRLLGEPYRPDAGS